MVTVNKLRKETHFISINSAYKAMNIVDISILRKISKTIISTTNPKIKSNFWKGSFEGLRSRLNFSTTYHPHKNGHIKRSNQIVKCISLI